MADFAAIIHATPPAEPARPVMLPGEREMQSFHRARREGVRVAAADLRRLGVRSVKDLARRDAERLYRRLCEITGQRQDPCVLYTFRCAVYAARTEKPEPELLNRAQ